MRAARCSSVALAARTRWDTSLGTPPTFSRAFSPPDAPAADAKEVTTRSGLRYTDLRRGAPGGRRAGGNGVPRQAGLIVSLLHCALRDVSCVLRGAGGGETAPQRGFIMAANVSVRLGDQARSPGHESGHARGRVAAPPLKEMRA